MTATEWTITSSPAMQAVEAEAERQHLASTADADRKLIGDDDGPHWKAVEHAEEVLSRVDATAYATVRALDAQCDARGREISRLRAELTRRRTEDLTLRGILAPADGRRPVPMALGDSVAPAVEWLIVEVDRLRAIDVAVLQVMDRIKAHADQGGETVLFRVLSDLAVARGLGRAPETNTWQES